PSNVFVCENNRVVLGDPSLPVQQVNVAPERLSYDYRYAAPETFDAKTTLGPQADFYSLGCVLYELVCGQPPFVSDNSVELAARHMHDAVIPPSLRGSRMGSDFDAVLLKLLTRSASNRLTRAPEIIMLSGLVTLGPDAQTSVAPLIHDAS